jgi:transcriptional regulator with XRE-family HTH domain
MRDTLQQAEFYRRLGANIRECRERRKLSQEAVARMVGLTRTSLTNIESGRQHPPLHTFCEIMEQLDADYTELIPRRPRATIAADLQERARQQVRGEDELAFIKTGIGIKEEKPHGNTKEKDSAIGRRTPK